MKVEKRNPDLAYVSADLWLPKNQMNVDAVKSALILQVSKGKGVETVVKMWKETEHHLVVPREMYDLAEITGQFRTVDARPQTYTRTYVKSRIVLDIKSPEFTTQKDSVAAMMRSHGGVLQLGCGLGKSVVALEVIARLQVPALIVVDTTQLVKQWGGEIDTFLEVPGGVGLLQGKVHDWKKAVCITTYQTLSSLADDLPEGMGAWFGVVIFDEGHHLGAEVFSRSANVVSGRRYGLTATPDRVDGTTRLYFSHLGKILYKDLRTDLEPTVVFYKTGISLDLGEESVRSVVCDVNGEVHHGKLSSYLGRHKGRTEIVLAEIRKARAEGRRCLILSYSIEELVNLFAAWSGVPGSYSDVPPPTAAEAGVTVPPEKLTAAKLNNQIKSRNVYRGKLARATGADREPLLFALKQVEYTLAKHEAALTMERAWDKRKDAYIQRVVAGATDAGLMIGDVHVDKRTKFLEEKKVVFAIMKYGREALNQPLLDTIIACESVGQEGALRQLLGRALRKREGKRSAVAVFFEDEIGLCIGMCRKLRRFLADNPQDAGGPIKFHIVNHDMKDNFWRRLA